MKKIVLLLLFILPLSVYAQVIITVAGNGIPGFAGDDGAATACELHSPYNVAVDDTGNIYIADRYNHRIRKVNTAGMITTICGNGAGGYFGDGGPAIYAEINGGEDIAFDKYGNLFITDNNSIRKIDTAGIIHTIAGNGIAGYNGDGIPAISAELHSPYGLAFDKNGNLYIADCLNYRIRKIDTAGIITTVGGTGTIGYSPDGSLADTASLGILYSIRVDKNGKIFFSDSARIRCIDSSRIITTIAGNGVYGFGGDGGPATDAIINPGGIATDTSGNLFIADQGNQRVRKVNSFGIISTIAGNGFGGYSGDWGDPLLAELKFPTGVAVDKIGNIYIGEVGNNVVREVTLDTPNSVHTIQQRNEYISIYPNPCSGVFTVYLSSPVTGHCTIAIANITGVQEVVKEGNTNAATEIKTGLQPGIYFVHITSTLEHFVQKLIIY